MMKLVFKTLLVLSFTATAFAQSPAVTENTEETPQVQKDQFATWVMNGWSAGLEYAAMNADMQIKGDGNTYGTATGNTNSSAGALGATASFNHLPRNRAGYSVGLGVINKIQNDESGATNTLRAAKSFTQIRPEGNVGYALGNGLYGMVGAHLSYIAGGSMTDTIQALGIGVQASVGYVATRNVGFDVGYYYSRHSLSQSAIDSIESQGYTINKDESYIAFSQLRGRVTYYF